MKLLLRQLLVANTVRLGRCIAEAFLAISFVLGVVTFEEQHVGVVLVGEDVRGDTVQEPPIVRDHDGCTWEVEQRFLQRTQGFDVEVVGRFVEQQDVAAFFQGQRQVQTATLTTGQVLDELLLIAALKLKRPT